MKVLELFAGTRSIGKAFEQRGHEVFSIDWNELFDDIDWYVDVNDITAQDIIDKFGHPDVIWASPDCATYSMARIRDHRKKNEVTGELEPISEYAKLCDRTNQYVIKLIKELNPKYWFVENPRAGMRTMLFMKDLPRYTTTYCQYNMDIPLEYRRQKPTDIWTNHPNPKFKPPCKRGASCHVSAPRGSNTGTQGIQCRHREKFRAMIPKQLCEHIVDICEE